VRFSIAIPQFVPDRGFDPQALAGYLARAEALGFEGAWTLEQVIGDAPILGPLETLAFAAAQSSTLRLGCAVLVSTLNSPLHVAKAVTTLDHLSCGRLEIGVGTGGRRAFPAFAVDPDSFVARFTEGIEIMQAVWTRPSVDLKGRFWTLEGVTQEPKPVQRPWPPLWFGGSHPAAIRRAVRLGDGFFGAGSQTTAQFAGQVPVVRQAVEEQGRKDFRIAKRVYIAVDDDAGRARERMAAALHRIYSSMAEGTDLSHAAVTGPPAACVEGLQAVADAGAEMILVNPLFDEAEQMERLAGEVLPQVSGT
jgi:alkanesulfonate monooxygenase SsuD/methylene tetrahydromethanopterin reductase-like flavin-dependent oxidoreductase (luciferase family)